MQNPYLELAENETDAPKKPTTTFMGSPEISQTPSAFELEMGMASAPEEAIPNEVPPKKVTNFKELTRPENLQTIRDYATVRFGKAGEQKKDESNEDYVKRWMTSMRQVEWNTTLNGVPELNWIYNAKENDVRKAAKAHELYKTVPDWYESGGQPGIRPFAEAAFSAISDPTSMISFGVGAAARYKAARLGIDAALKSKLTAVGAGAAVEAAVGGAESLVQQQREIELDNITDIDMLNQLKADDEIDEYMYEAGKQKILERKPDALQAGLAAAFSAVFGGIEARSAFRAPKLTTRQDLEEVLKSRKKTPSPTDPETEKLVQDFDAELEDILTKFDIFEGRKVLDDLSPQQELVQAEIRTDINRKAIDVAKYVMLLDPSFRPKANQKVSDAVKDVFMSFEEVDDVVLDAALKRANLTPTEFAQATRTTVADAASVMQGYSALARTLKRVANVDPEAEKIINDMYGRDQDVTSAMGYLMDGVRRLERESKALVVSSIATTVRNVMGTTTGMTWEAASRLIEGTLYTTGKALKGAATGTYERGDISRGLQTTVRDAFGLLTYLTNAGISAEVTDAVLANNPRIKQQLFSALQETGNADLSRVARFANTFNVAQDVLFRRAAFNASVERQLRGVGLDMYQLIADGKDIPADVIKNAADDALKATFSYMPKPHKAGQKTVEAKAEGLANQFVRFFESMPGGSLLVTFPRFMTNAMAFQYKYSPIGGTSGVGDMIKASAMFAKDQEGAERLMREGVDKFSKGLFGSAVIYSAYKYRLENQNTEWYNVQGEDGSTVDTRAIFPIGPYLAVGDFLAKMELGKEDEAKVSEMVQTIVGMKLPAGAQATLLDSLPELIAESEGKEADKLKKSVGKLIGDFAGRFVQPGQPIFAYFDLFDKEAQIARDPNVIEGDDLVSEAAMNRVKAKLPGFKEDLPEAKRYLREETPVRGGEFFSVLTGMRIVPRANDIEKEFSSLGLEPYTFFGASGDKVYDRKVIEESGPYIDKIVGGLLKAPRYEAMTPAQKKLAIAENMSTALNIGRNMAQAEMSATDRGRVNKMTFNKLPQRERRAINEMYAKENYGLTLDEAKDYDRVYEYQAKISRFR
jgi:hypothetical protein